MSRPQSPLTPQMQDALQRGDLRALMHAVRASGASVDLPAARRALQQQLREHAQQQAPSGGLPQAQAAARAAADAARSATQAAAQVLPKRTRTPTVVMGDRPGETRWVLIVALLLALAVWLAFGGLDALPGGS